MSAQLSIIQQIQLNAAHRAFELARSRYVRARSAEDTAARVQSIRRERFALATSLVRLEAALDFHTERVARARRAFEGAGAGRLRDLEVEPPTLLERLLSGGSNQRLYRDLRLWMFCRDEVVRELRKHRDRMAHLTRQMAAVEEAQKTTVERRLGTPAGLREALAADAQLALAHGRLAQIVHQKPA